MPEQFVPITSVPDDSILESGFAQRPKSPCKDARMIEVFADITCPFTHAGLRRLIDHRSALGSDVRFHFKAWPLEWVNGEPLAPDFVAAEIGAIRQQVAPDLFQGFDPSRFPSTTIAAHALSSLAYSRAPDLGEAVGLALRDAVFERGRDVGDAAVLNEVAAEFGLEAASLDLGVLRSEYEEGIARGVVGSPYFFIVDVGYFCPALDIAKVDGHFVITTDVAAFDDFVARAFGRAS